MHEYLINVSLKPASNSDATFVNNLTRFVMWEYVCKTWSKENDIEKYFNDNLFKKDGTEIILIGNERIGRITLIEDSSCMTIEELHIHPDYQSKGIGSLLINRVLEKSSKLSKITRLMVLKSNPAKSLYHKLGFATYQETKERLYMEISYAKTK